MEIKVLQLHKKSSYEYKNIQDKYCLSTTTKSIALSDGTTQSFKSELWAGMLVNSFANNPSFDLNSLKVNFKSLATEFKNMNFDFSLNFAKASLEKAKRDKGGTATFIGLQLIDNSTIKVINCGDTCLFIIRDNKIISFPFKNLDELDNNNFFINSSKLLENEIENEFFNLDEISIQKDDLIILATDAVSRLIFRNPESISSIIKCNNFEDFKDFCETNWKKNELEEDDISIVTISPLLEDKIISIIPPEDFSFPVVVENVFIPSIEGQNFINNIDNLEMEQLNRMIEQLSRETNFIKNKLKLTQALLVSSLAILVVNTLLLFYFIIIKKDSFQTKDKTKVEFSTQVDEKINADEKEGKVTLNEVEVKLEKDAGKPTIESGKKDLNNNTQNEILTPVSKQSDKNSSTKEETVEDDIKQ
jgi:hypothetical protein